MSNKISDNICNLENILDDIDCNSQYVNIYKDYINISNKYCNDNINSQYCQEYINKEIKNSNNDIIYIDKIHKKNLKQKKCLSFNNLFTSECLYINLTNDYIILFLLFVFFIVYLLIKNKLKKKEFNKMNHNIY